MPEANSPVAVALLYPSQQHGGHLRDAMKEFGAEVVYEALAAEIDRDALEGSGARVVIVNLGSDADDYIDQVYDVLDAGDYQVVFNEAQVSEQLSGWDLARWARNLAAKILSRPDIAEPPRPAGAEPVPTPVQKSASVVPTAERPGKAAETESTAPTVTLPVPEEFRAETPAAEPAPEPVAADELEQFARLAAPEPEEAEPAEAPATDAGLAAELDALFASADSAAAATEPGLDLPDEFNLAEASGPELDIDLPADFDLSGSELPAAESAGNDVGAGMSVEEPEPEQAPAATGPEDELSLEFPAIFDQLDESAAEIPEASDNEFRPAAREPRPTGDSTEPVLPPEWSLEPLVAEAPAEDAAEAAKPSDFGIEKVSAEEFLAPESDAPAAAEEFHAADAGGGLSFELMPMEEAIAPKSDYSHENWLEGSGEDKKLKVGSGKGVERVCVLGASIGGPEAVRDFLGALPKGFPVLFVLAQHMGPEFLELMAGQLRKSIKLTVREPTHGERVSDGDVLIVPTTHRVKVDAEGVVTLAHLPEKLPYSPSIDQVLRDVADQFGGKSVAIIFSGMAHDAIEGSRYLKSKGGSVWAQDPQTCVISSMVDGVRQAGLVDFMGSPAQLAQKMAEQYSKA